MAVGCTALTVGAISKLMLLLVMISLYFARACVSLLICAFLRTADELEFALRENAYLKDLLRRLQSQLQR